MPFVEVNKKNSAIVIAPMGTMPDPVAGCNGHAQKSETDFANRVAQVHGPIVAHTTFYLFIAIGAEIIRCFRLKTDCDCDRD
jgi:hypothetical protein